MPNAAKSDLKRQLKNFNVRPAIVSAIEKAVLQTSRADSESDPSTANTRSHLAESVSSIASAPAPVLRSETPALELKVEQVEPSYVNTVRELDDIFRDMTPCFEGKESEQNWLKREQSCTQLRRLNAGNASTDFHDAFIPHIKSLLDGILKAVNSLRTSLSKEGCFLVQELAKSLGPGIDGMVEILLQSLIKLCGGTKKISSQMGNETVDIIIGRVTYTARIMQHIWLACQDKNVQPRTYATGWLKTLLKKEANHKSHLEHAGGLEVIEKCVKRGLTDANPGVREKMRGTYWTLHQMWPQKAEAIAATLEAPQQRLLELDPANPKTPKKVATSSARPGLGFSKSVHGGPPKPSLRETMLAQKKAAMAQKTLPPRPGSAMSTFQSPAPMRSTSNMSVASTSSKASTAGFSRSTHGSSTVAHGGLSVAPMRPAKAKRPEIARPATAGPYSVRRTAAPSTESSGSTAVSPVTARTKPRTPSVSAHTSPVKLRPRTGSISVQTSPRKTEPRPRSRTSHSASNSSSGISHTSPGKQALNRSQTSPRVHPPSPRASPQRQRPVTMIAYPSPMKFGPTGTDEELTMVVPNISNALAESTSSVSGSVPESVPESAPESAPESVPESGPATPKDVAEGTEPTINGVSSPMKQHLNIYEDPVTGTESDATKPTPEITEPVLSELPVNEDTSALALRVDGVADKLVSGLQNGTLSTPSAPAATDSSTMLIDSGIRKVEGKVLDGSSAHKFFGQLKKSKLVNEGTDNQKLMKLIDSLLDYISEPPPINPPTTDFQKIRDVRTYSIRILMLLVQKRPECFDSKVDRAISALMSASYDYENFHAIVIPIANLSELLADLVSAEELAKIVTTLMQNVSFEKVPCYSTAGKPFLPEDMTAEEKVNAYGRSRMLIYGFQLLRKKFDKLPQLEKSNGGESSEKTDVDSGASSGSSEDAAEAEGPVSSVFNPDWKPLAALLTKGMESEDSRMRMATTDVCVALAMKGEKTFWQGMGKMHKAHRAVITYMVVRRRKDAADMNDSEIEA